MPLQADYINPNEVWVSKRKSGVRRTDRRGHESDKLPAGEIPDKSSSDSDDSGDVPEQQSDTGVWDPLKHMIRLSLLESEQRMCALSSKPDMSKGMDGLPVARYTLILRVELKYQRLLLKHFASPGSSIRKIEAAFFDEMKSKESDALIRSELNFRRYIENSLKHVLEDTVLARETVKRLVRCMQRLFITKWLEITKLQASNPRALQASGTTLFQTQQMAERVRELQQTPTLYSAWLKEGLRRSVCDNGQAI